MFEKWKLIINNWMNCYFNNDKKHEECVNLDSLLKVISYLRKNYNLNESISSSLGAHTVEEFIREKYPSFKFANGTVIASNEDEVYLVASLLLFFVCVNSKDENIKNAMCSRLSPEDQKIILAFSRSLMECSPVTCKDVQAAITDACGLDMATTETSHVSVAETPPALRSLHSEVRRLQAALDAERFDRNYLQEELARINMRMEKLLRDKEQYNLEIVHLKAKISMCCGQEEVKTTESQMDMSARLRKQLQEMEERLVCAVEKLDDVTYERNTLKAKMNELKQDRDKWFNQSQQESAHAAELSEDLETERRHVHSLRELVSELQQHNRRNGLDTSQLECDDPDISTQSLPHNLSNFSEACANVVEVQLAEERAKAGVLKQQIQNLQDQINVLTQKLESEKQNSEKILSYKENDIFNLKHQINEEIEEKNILKENFNYEISKLNNINNEIEQKFKDNTEKARQIINQKIQEIQTLQEEKLSLLQIFSNETTKLENIIQNLKTDIENEKQAKSNMKDSYENHIMKLNEKVMNRNNELVELQNNMFEKSGMIESLHIDLKKEREHKEQVNSKYHEDMSHINEVKIQLEYDLQKKTEELIIMQQNFEQKISALINELDHFKSMKNNFEIKYENKCKHLADVTIQLNEEIGQKNNDIIILKQELKEAAQINQQKYEEIKILQQKLSQEIDTGRELLYQKEIEIKELQIKLNNQESLNNELELEFKKAVNSLQQTIEALQKENEQLHFEIEEDNINHEVIIKEKDKIIDKLEQDLKGKNIQIESIRKDYEDIIHVWEKFKMETYESIGSKEDHINKLRNDIICIKNNLVNRDNVKTNLLKKIENIAIQKNEMEQTYRDEISKLLESLQLGENKYVVIALEKDNIEKHLLEVKVAKEFLETEKVEMTKTINTLIADNNKLTNEITILQQQLLEEKSVREITAKEKELIEDKLATEKVMIKKLLGEKACLKQHIVEEKLTKEILEKENKLLKQNLAKQVSMVKELLEEKNFVAQELVEEKRAKDLIEKEREITENKLVKEISTVKILLEEKECLAQQLIEEKSAKDLTEKEKEIILTEKGLLEQKFSNELSIKEVLQYEIQNMNKNQEIFEQRYNNDKSKLLQELTAEKSTKDGILKHNESLIAEKETLSFELTEQKAIQKVLISDKQLLIDEKEALVKSLTEEKAFYDEIENEKIELSKKLKGLNENYSKEIKKKQIELDNIKQDMKHLEINCLNQVALNKDLSTTLSDGLNKLIQVLKKEEIRNDVLQKLIEVDPRDIPVNNKCEMLINFVNTLTNELAMRNNLEKTHESIIITELREAIQQKELYILEHQTEVKRLQQVADESKIELSKQAETYTTALDTMSRQMESLKQENQSLTNDFNDVKLQLEVKVHSLKEKLIDNEDLTDKLKRTYETQIDNLNVMITKLTSYLKDKTIEIETARKENERLQQVIENNNEAINYLEDKLKTEKQNEEKLISDFESERHILKNMVIVTESVMEDQKVALNKVISEHLKNNESFQEDIKAMKLKMDSERKHFETKIQEKDNALESIFKELAEERLKSEQAVKDADSNKVVFSAEVTKLNEELNGVLNQLKKLEAENEDLTNALKNCKDSLQALELEYDDFKIEKDSVEKKLQNEIHELKQGFECTLKEKTQNILELQGKVGLLNEQIKLSATEKSKLEEEKYDLIKKLNERKLNESQSKLDSNVLKNNEELTRLINDNINFINVNEENKIIAVIEKASCQKNSVEAEKEHRDLHHQVDNTSSDITPSSLESLKTISDLEKIIHDKNRTITTLQSDVTFLKSLMAESETKLLDVSKELEISNENCQQLSYQLQKIVQQKNEEIAELKKQVSKMSVTENRATQIIKVSAKYQAIILKRIAEIKTNTVLKELTNYGNSNNCDNELRRSLSAGAITMEELENFLETTDRHLKRCSEKQVVLQKERDRLAEVNRIYESEIINLKKFLTELSMTFQTFNSVKDLYSQKLIRVISVQRTVRREILNMEGRITDACMCKLERGYAAVMQDLSECAMNLQRWVERSIGRTISPEKIKQAFMNDLERASLAPTNYQNAGLDVQLEELDKSFQKLLDEVTLAQKGEGSKDVQAVTVMEVRAEYEDKLNRMKAKMKQLYIEQIAVFKEKQKEEISLLERELQRARDKLAESSSAYEEHIRGLTTELWNVGEKFLMEKNEAEWLRRKQNSGSLMSLQHVHSSGLVAPQQSQARPSDTYSLRSLPVNNHTTGKRAGRGMHVSDEEGEVFDNRCLAELSATPGRAGDRGQRLSELQWRNSLCPPHLKSSYPAETQFTPALNEEVIKCTTNVGAPAVRPQRKEVGITAYKKPGPPTPSKQAGRLSATDSELRESLRVEADPQPSRKTSTPSRIRSLFRSSRNDTAEGTPRSKRLSHIFRKK